MNMNQFIKDTLSPTGVSVSYLTYTGSANQYIVFSYWSVPLAHADNKEIQSNITVQIDVFSSGNFTALVEEVKDRMIAAGFMKMLEDSGEYIEEANLFHKMMRFSYQT